MKALMNRPDLRAAQQGVTAANSQYLLQKADGKQDVTVSGNYSHVNAISAASFSRKHSRWRSSIATRAKSCGQNIAVTQAQEQQSFTNGQVLTDVKDAYEGLQSNDKIVQLYLSQVSGCGDPVTRYQQLRLPSWRYRTDRFSGCRTQLSSDANLPTGRPWPSYLLALEQLREAVGARNLQ